MEELLRELALLDGKANYEKSLALLRALKAGRVRLEEVTLTLDGWQVAAVPSPSPQAPDGDPV